METEMISHCIGPLSRDYLSKLPHHVAPSMNLHRVLPCADGDTSTLLSKPFPYSSSVPVPLAPITNLTREVINGIDPVTKLVREKIKWEMKKERILSAVLKDKNNISGKVIKKAVKLPVDSKAVVPRGVVLLAQHLDRDPDPHFSGESNWYYTGGTLATLRHRDDHYLLHASPGILNCSRVVEGRRLEPPSVLDLESRDPCYQVTANARGVAVRQPFCVQVAAITENDDGTCQLNRVHRISDKKCPFLSVTLRENSLRKYATLSSSGHLKLWDIEKDKGPTSMIQIAPGEGITVTDSWRAVHFLDNKTLLMVDRCCLHLLDLRANLREKQMAWCPKKLTEQCEEISHVVCSRLKDHSVYTLTSHQALNLDLRFGFCQRWTHMMAAPPHLGFTQVMENEHEVVCVGSQVLSDCAAIVNTWRGEEPQSHYRPCCLPAPAKGLHLARAHGLCLDPSLTQRCTQSMTGLTWLPHNHVVRQSATADLFIQQLGPPDQLTEPDLAAFSEWCQPTLSLKREPTLLPVSQVADFSPVFKAITNPQTPIDEFTKIADLGGTWKISKKYLEDCVDMLAGKMLAVWDVEDEDEWAEQVEEEVIPEQDTAEKVENWLASTNPKSDMSGLKPTVTSTPFPAPPFSSRQEQDISPTQNNTPFMKSQVTPPMYDLSPPSSTRSNQNSWKKQKLYHDSFVSTPPRQKQETRPLYRSDSPLSTRSKQNTPKKQELFDDSNTSVRPKQPTSVKKPQSSAKKKFVPGF